jgi:hypothetical protein
MKSNKESLIGQKFGNLTVIKQDGVNKWGQSLWSCYCDCGRMTQALISPLKSGGKKSCGCINNPIGAKHVHWRGIGDLGLSYLSRIKNESVRHGRECDLTLEFLWDLFLKQNKSCALSGIPLILGKSKKDKARTASLDRIDSKKGYIQENVQWVDKRINFMKQRFSVEEFKDLCKKVSEHNVV